MHNQHMTSRAPKSSNANGPATSAQYQATPDRSAHERRAQVRAAQERTAQKRTAPQPTALQPTALQPTTLQPTTLQPTALQPTAHQRPAHDRAAHWSAALSLAASAVLLAMLAAIAAWLSFQAQSSYVLAHNGGSLTQARAWAVLLDAATAGVSLLRLHDALTGCGAIWATRLVLAGCITASVTMNLLHTVCRAFGGLLVAGVPPVLYAVLLELLLAKITQLLLPDRRGATATKLRRAATWAHFPATMWHDHRTRLRHAIRDRADSEPDADARLTAEAIDECAATPTGRTQHALPDTVCTAPFPFSPPPAPTPEPLRRAEIPPRAEDPHRRPRRGRPALKRTAFEAHLIAQVRSGDSRVLSPDHRTRNRAAYEAAAALPAPLSPGTARRYVLDALPRVRAAQHADAH